MTEEKLNESEVLEYLDLRLEYWRERIKELLHREKDENGQAKPEDVELMKESGNFAHKKAWNELIARQKL